MRLAGKILGYPNCCIDSFIERCSLALDQIKKIPKRKLSGTGYIPCEQCNFQFSSEELIIRINKNRQLSTPFPKVKHSEITRLLEEQKLT